MMVFWIGERADHLLSEFPLTRPSAFCTCIAARFWDNVPNQRFITLHRAGRSANAIHEDDRCSLSGSVLRGMSTLGQ